MTAVAQLVAPRQLGRELLRTARPQQWVKNVLVLSAPAAAGVLLRPEVLWRCLVAVVAVTFAASGCYLVNDVRDRHLDRQHPRKRLRPVASGAVPVELAVVTAWLLVGAGLALAAVDGTLVLLAVGGYVALTVLYAMALKHVPWLEMAVVAFGFVLRALVGAAAAGVNASGWFLAVVSAAAVHVVASKRASELREGGHESRPVLRAYTPVRLRVLRVASAVVLVTSYASWALARPGTLVAVLATASTVPVVLVVGRWTWRTERGGTAAPEQVLLEDPVVRTGVALWLLAFVATVLAALLTA